MSDAAAIETGNSPPAWDAVAHDVLCPLCEYNLRGLSEARCPECGYRFDWAVVADPVARTHPFLFEYHPKRNLWSFGRTVRGTLWPWEFWDTLSPVQSPRPGRLRLYWLLTTMVALTGPLAIGVLGTYQRYSSGLWMLGFSSGWERLLRSARSTWNRDALFAFTWYASLFWVAWPWLTLAVLMIFGTSMRKAKVKSGHVLRCVVYSFDFGTWFGPAIAFIAWFALAGTTIRTARGQQISPGVVMFVTGSLFVTILVRLWLAYRLYLHFDHPFWTVLATQVIVFLMLLGVVAYW